MSPDPEVAAILATVYNITVIKSCLCETKGTSSRIRACTILYFIPMMSVLPYLKPTDNLIVSCLSSTDVVLRNVATLLRDALMFV